MERISVPLVETKLSVVAVDGPALISYPHSVLWILMGVTDKRPVWFLVSQHWLSLLGMALLATALISSLFVLPQQVRGHVENPYVGIIIFLVPPIIFLAGLILIPIGIYLGKRKIREGIAEVVSRARIGESNT
jgi:hypothetical protein